jgi:hypothetical protein
MQKKLLILCPPFIFVGLLLFLYLPNQWKPFSFLTGLLFWITYQIWVNIENKEKKSFENSKL